MPLIFVYGTLKKGYGLNDVLRGCELVQPNAVLDRQLRMVDNGGFPYLVEPRPDKVSPDGRVKELGDDSYYPTGEVYKVTDPELMQRLDQIEGAYDRTKAKTKCGLNVQFYLAKGGAHRAWYNMPNRYVQINTPEPGQVTWGKKTWAGGDVQIHGQYGEPYNELTIRTGDEEQGLADELPSGLTTAQKLTVMAISNGHFEIKIDVDGVATLVVKPTDDDRDEGGDDDGE